ncbi:unnamed protein product, partial [Allacma fusca]
RILCVAQMKIVIPTSLVLFWASVVNLYGVPCPNQHGKVKCTNSYYCIPRPWECDGINHCPDNTDEKGCPDCLGIYCDSNQTFVPRTRICNFFLDCNDGSDEDASRFGCECPGFKCSNGRCIRNDSHCDSFIDCWPTAEDELGCPCDGPSLFRCGADGPCLNIFYRCDGISHCPNGEDEQNCPCAFKCADGSCLMRSWVKASGFSS